MSSTDHHSHPAQGNPLAVEPQDEQLPIGKLLAVTIVSLVAFALGILWAVGILRGVEDDTRRAFGPGQAPSEVGKQEIGMVDQTLFAREQRAAMLTKEKSTQLDSYGWVSRSQQIIHIPIGEAMKAVVAGKRAPGGGVPAPSLMPMPVPGVTTPAVPMGLPDVTGRANPLPQPGAATGAAPTGAATGGSAPANP